MEAVPRLPMLSFELKISPEPTSFGSKLKQYIRDFYNEDPESYTNEIYQLENLRAMAVRPPIAVIGCSLLKKYYCQLHFVQSRFPMGTDEPAAVPFSWRDSYANIVFTLSNIRFEIISILYNIGTIHTQLGAKTERTTADGMKMACSHFQCAAWAFENLQNTNPQPPGVDMTSDLMKFMNQLCLAQAQECILEKSMLDHRKPTIVAKVAKQIVDYYSLACQTLEPNKNEDNPISETVGTKIYKSWKNYVTFKRSYYMSVTYLYQGLTAEEQQKMGERVAFYKEALSSLNSARLLYTNSKTSIIINGMTSEKESIEDSLVFTNDVIEGKKKAATNENDFIYHEEVPDKDVLPTINGASLVKGISFSVNDAEISGPDIFARLVPMKVHEASSLYSEEKAKILRSIGSKIDENNQLLETYLSSLKLQHLQLWDPDNPLNNDEYFSLPEELVERCAVLNAKPTAIHDLEELMEKLSSTYGDVETMLNDINKLLTIEDKKEKEYQDLVGKRPPTIVATDLTREAKKYEEAHAKASESNKALHRAMNLHLNNLHILEQPLSVLISNVPSIESIDKMNENDKKNVRELKRMLVKVDQMQIQRADLHAKLRESIEQDNITRLLVTATAESSPLDVIFSEQLKKHEKIVNLIEQNLIAQDNILTALTDAYAKTAETRKSVENILKQREIMITSLISSYDAYEDLLIKSSKGLEFYRKLEVNVTKLLQRVKSTCRVQDEEREQILSRNDKQQPDIYSTKGVSIVSVVPTSDNNNINNNNNSDKKIGSGMKLKDHLANRLKINTDKSNITSITHIQPSIDSSHDFNNIEDIYNPGNNPLHSIDQQHMYQQYQAYYSSKTNPYSAGQSSYNETILPTNYIDVNQSLPRSSTTNTNTMYQQAGRVSSTDVSTDSSVYANYSNGNQQQQQQQGGGSHYPISGYDNASQYHNQLYQVPQVSMSSQISQNNYQLPIQNHHHQIPPTLQNYQSNNQSATMNNQKSIIISGHEDLNSQEIIPQTSYYQQYNNATDDNATNNYSTITTTTPPINQVTYSIPQDNKNVNYVNQNTQEIPVNTFIKNTNFVQPDNNQGTNYLQQHYYNNITNYPHNISQSAYVVPSQQQTYVDPSQSQQQQTYVDPNQSQQQQTYVDPNQSQQQQQAYVDPNQSSIAPLNNYVIPDSQNYNTNNYVQNHLSLSNESRNYTKEPDIIQSHAKTMNNIQIPYTTSSQYSIQSHNNNAYSNYTQGYNLSQDQQLQQINNPSSYQGHPGYVYDSTSGGYQYSSGYQNSQLPQEQISINQQTIGQIPSVIDNSHYTNANNTPLTSVTISSSYSLDNKYQPELNDNNNYYTTPYGLQQTYNQLSTITTNNQTNINYANTYIQSSDNKTTTTNSISSSSIDKPQSNLDLLAGLDITINHAPLLPEINSTIKDKNDDKIDDSVNNNIIAINNNINNNKDDDDKDVKLSTNCINEKLENLQIVWDTWYNDVQPKQDPLGDPIILQKFITDIEKYEKFVESLTVKTLNGSTNLDIKWKEIRDFEEREFIKQTNNAAKLNTDKNRTNDLIPYDSTRVKLTTNEKSDYINASYIKNLTQWTPSFIVTQSPMSQTFESFWTMIFEQQCEVIASLSNESSEQDNIYWPTNIDVPMIIGNFTLILKNLTKHTTYIQSIINIIDNKKIIEKTVVHMQFISWPINGLPSSPGAILSFATDIMSEQALRHCPNPIVVHCKIGGSLSSLFLLATATICHVRAGHGIVDVPLIFSTFVKYRKCLIDKDYLLFGYRMVLYYAQDTLMKRGILSSTKTTFDAVFNGAEGIKGKQVKKNQFCHPSDDFLHNLNVGIAGISTSQNNRKKILPESPTKTNFDSENKTDRVKPVDPLSQLDPLWTIRK
ncbi:hypothetical protein HCN44_000579 [Aphidius gifuensis]|uniref:Tyrosine-protein phosphatase non-receptor type 23 n=1 Tax=Aphidius gifuensis TaxID=684658 RepID=A0A834XT43_APHGI|nr:tyrosine-protein phosphatase non-receptor type 23 [Aphidius gifuensis]KAF7990774.1 hypothetical protein HCN44_000579 [Aphidius gifuensis]